SYPAFLSNASAVRRIVLLSSMIITLIPTQQNPLKPSITIAVRAFRWCDFGFLPGPHVRARASGAKILAYCATPAIASRRYRASLESRRLVAVLTNAHRRILF